jgi:hypothetical protein
MQAMIWRLAARSGSGSTLVTAVALIGTSPASVKQPGRLPTSSGVEEYDDRSRGVSDGLLYRL